eukprot:m.959725 g.959725  ORF g.959725 m.959725 type:complete len:57 (+) comp23882_c0_seq61:2478-2648(+)
MGNAQQQYYGRMHHQKTDNCSSAVASKRRSLGFCDPAALDRTQIPFRLLKIRIVAR